MGESIFLESMISWLQRMLSGNARALEWTEEEEEEEEEEDALVQEIFAPRVPQGSEIGGGSTNGTLHEDTPQRPTMEVHHLSRELAESGYTNGHNLKAAIPGKNGAAAVGILEREANPTGRVNIESHQGWEAAHEADAPDSGSYPSNRVIVRALVEEPFDGEGGVVVKRLDEATTLDNMAKPQKGPESGDVLDFLSTSIKDIFQKSVVASPHVKALARRHGLVDARELVGELDEFVKGFEKVGESGG